MSTLDSDADMRDRVERALVARFDREVAEHATYEKLGGHASLRIYWRIHLPTHEPGVDWELESHEEATTLIAMVLAPGYEPARSAEGPDDERLDVEGLPFVDVQRYLDDLDVPVPAIEHVDREVDVLLLEDLGDRTFEDVFLEIDRAEDVPESVRQSEIASLYRQPVELLVDLQAAVERSREEAGESVRERCVCWRRHFDDETLRWELDHYMVWGIQRRPETPDLDAAQTEALGEHFDGLVDELLELDQTVALRDFQSRNLMYKERPDLERPFHKQPWVVIDFQDALVAPYVYDLVSLLRDSYIELGVGLVSRLLDYYVEQGREAGLPWCDEPAAVRRAFHLQTVQRKLKDAGRFVYLDREKGNPDFLPYYEPSIRYVDHALEQLAGWDELRDLLHRVEPAM